MTSISAKNESSEPNREEELDILKNNCLLWPLQKCQCREAKKGRRTVPD